MKPVCRGALVVCLLVSLAAFSQAFAIPAHAETPTELTEESWRASVIESLEPVLVDFWATWCLPCKGLDPVVAEIGQQRPFGVKVFKLDIDRNAKIAARYDVFGVPTMKLFVRGKVVGTLLGGREKAEIVSFIKENLP